MEYQWVGQGPGQGHQLWVKVRGREGGREGGKEGRREGWMDGFRDATQYMDGSKVTTSE